MKTHKIQQASLLAYRSLQPELPYKQWQIFEVLGRVQAMSNRQLSIELGLEISDVAGRTNELAKQGRVCEYDKQRDLITGKTVIRWCVVPRDGQLKLL